MEHPSIRNKDQICRSTVFCCDLFFVPIIWFIISVESPLRWHLSFGCQLSGNGSQGKLNGAQQVWLMPLLLSQLHEIWGQPQYSSSFAVLFVPTLSPSSCAVIPDLLIGPRWSTLDKKSIDCITLTSMLVDIYIKNCLSSSSLGTWKTSACKSCQCGLTSLDFGVNKQQSGHSSGLSKRFAAVQYWIFLLPLWPHLFKDNEVVCVQSVHFLAYFIPLGLPMQILCDRHAALLCCVICSTYRTVIFCPEIHQEKVLMFKLRPIILFFSPLEFSNLLSYLLTNSSSILIILHFFVTAIKFRGLRGLRFGCTLSIYSFNL